MVANAVLNGREFFRWDDIGGEGMVVQRRNRFHYLMSFPTTSPVAIRRGRQSAMSSFEEEALLARTMEPTTSVATLGSVVGSRRCTYTVFWNCGAFRDLEEALEAGDILDGNRRESRIRPWRTAFWRERLRERWFDIRVA